MAVQGYDGGCQCGAVRFKTSVDIDQAIACNCSRCGRLGLTLAFAPEADFTLEQGEGALSEYRFNKHQIEHRFCATCGVQSFARATAPDGRPMVAVNVRCLDGIDTNAMTSTPYDGRSL